MKSRAQKAGRPQKSDSLRAIAERLSTELGFPVTIKMVREWQAKEYPLDDIRKLRRELETQQRVPGETEDPASQSLREQILRAELRRKLASADRLEMEARKVRGELVERAGLKAQGEAVGFTLRQALDRLAHDLPPQLAGCTTAEIKKTLTKRFRETLQGIADTPAAKLIESYSHGTID
jgi:hypothetical protein